MQTLLDKFPQMKWYQKIVVFIVFAIWLFVVYSESPHFIVDWNINYNAFNSIPALFGFGMSVFVLFAVIPFVSVICAYIIEFPIWLVNKLLITPIKFVWRNIKYKGSKNASM